MPYKNAVFIDQTALLAFLGHPDYEVYHNAMQSWLNSFFKGEYGKKYDLLVTSDYVVMFVAEKLFEIKQNENILVFIKNLIRSSSIKIINVHEDGFTHACRNIETYYQIFKFNFSMTDITSLFLLKSSRIKAILTCNPLFHRLEYLISLDFNPEKDEVEHRLIYDAVPDNLFTAEKEKPFSIYNKEVNPENTICLFEIELSFWTIDKIEVDESYFVTKLKLRFDFTPNEETILIPDSILNLDYLVELDLSNTKISEEFSNLFDTLKQLQNLKRLDLTKNGLLRVPENLNPLIKKNCEILI